jgi:outer membrane protein assembly factor BamB
MAIRALVRRLGSATLLLAALCASGVFPAAASHADAPHPVRARTSAATSTNATWTTYHHDARRSGYDPLQPAFTSIKPGWSAPATVDGAVYAEPLISGNTVVVATESDSVYGLDVATGTILWHANLGTPVPNSMLPCGDVDPVGITSTPVINSAAGIVYVVGMVLRSGNAMEYDLAAISLASGSILYQEPINVSGLDAVYHIQRGALTLLNGFVYIPFGGRFGDCTPYHGWLVGARASGGGPFFAFQTSLDDGGGLWQPAGASVDALGHIYVTSGNTYCPSPCTTNDGGEVVFQLISNTQLSIACPISGCAYHLTKTDYFAPSDYATLDANDPDLGSTGPLLVNGGLIFQVGKAGDGYLLSQTALGGVGGQVYTAHVCPNLTDDAAFGGDAYADPYIYVPCRDGVVALTLDSSSPSFAFAWHGPTTQGSGPPIVAGGLVWTMAPGGTLYALDPTTGAIVYSDYIGPAEHFATPAAGDGAVIAAAATQIYSFVNG